MIFAWNGEIGDGRMMVMMMMMSLCLKQLNCYKVFLILQKKPPFEYSRHESTESRFFFILMTGLD